MIYWYELCVLTRYNFLGFNSSNKNAVDMSFHHVVCLQLNCSGPQNFFMSQRIESKKGQFISYDLWRLSFLLLYQIKMAEDSA